MADSKHLYRAFFKAQDRFINHRVTSSGFEPDVIYDYIHCGIALASHHEPHADQQNWLLCELFIRQVYFHLIEAIQDPLRSLVFRRVCLDNIHTPLLFLKRFYYHFEHGEKAFGQVQKALMQLQAPLDR